MNKILKKESYGRKIIKQQTKITLKKSVILKDVSQKQIKTISKKASLFTSRLKKKINKITKIKFRKNFLKKKDLRSKLKKNNFKLKKKWRYWRVFKQFFISLKKISFFNKLKNSFNHTRIARHQLIKFYLPTKNKMLVKYTNKLGHKNFFFFLRKLELRLSVLLLRARFFYKLMNCYTAIKLKHILINGIIINKINFLARPLDLLQKRRIFRQKKKGVLKRKIRFKWRKNRWKQARFVIWKIRRTSHFNMYWIRKQNTTLNYLEINYKIPGAVVLKQPFLKELLLNKQPKLLTKFILKKIYFLY